MEANCRFRNVVMLCLLCMISVAAYGQKITVGPIYGEGQQFKVDVRHLKWSDFEGLLPSRAASTRGGGTTIKWIDRVGNMPDYLKDFYQVYGQKVDEVMNGQSNWLDNPELASGHDVNTGTYYETVKTLTGTVDFTFPAGSSPEDIRKAARQAVSDACANAANEYTCFINYLILCLNYDYPQAFWTGNTAYWGNSWPYSYTYDPTGTSGTAEYQLNQTFMLKTNNFDYRIAEFRDASTIPPAVTEFNEKVTAITDQFKTKSRYEQVAGLNDWLTTHNSYNSDLIATGTAPDIAHSPLSALRESTGALGPVCEGYARAFKVLCDKLDIPCILANGNAKSSPNGEGEAHMWNEVGMDDDKWYAVDVTWNDPIMYGADNNQKVSGGESQFWLLLGKYDEVSSGFTFEQSHPNTPAGDNPNQSQWEILFTSLIADHGYETGVTPPPTESVRTFNNVTAGSLPTLISDAEKYTIEELTITGELNGTDFRLIREMAGNDYLGQPTNGMLKKLDISGANIVEGGEKYLDADNVYSSTGTYTHMGGDFFHFGTQNNVLGHSIFAGCDKLEEVVLPNSITSIGDYVFWFCLKLKALEIPENVSSIGRDFVFGPNQLSKLTVVEGNMTYSSPTNSNALMQGSKLVFGISSTQIPTGTTVIGSNAFEDCNPLGDVTLPEGVTTIEVGAFAWSGLTSINMPSTLTTIGNDAFAGCNGLTSFTLPKSVVTYGDGLGALKDCHNLTSIQVEDGNPNYDSRNDCNAIIETATNTLVSGCQATVIPNTVTILGHQAFRGASLSDFVIPDWITRIGERAFWDSSLSSVKIPGSVASIGRYAFTWCNNLTTVTIENKVPLAIEENTFSNRANIDLIVPVGSVGLYKAANYWKDFKSIKDTEGNTEPAATPISLTLNVETAGTLPTLISETDKYLTTELTLTGNLNGTDFRLIREMAGNDYLGQPTNGVLKKLDISGANIVAGGEKYLDADEVWSSHRTYAHWGGEYFHFNTQQNILGNAMFAGCEKLVEIVLPKSITSIGNLAFFDCMNLESLVIPENVSSIGEDVFVECNKLSGVSVAEGNQTFSAPANCNVLMEGTTLRNAFANPVIPDGTTVIGSRAFERYNGNPDFVVPEGVVSIGNNAFAWSNIKSISLPSTLKRIDYWAFSLTQLESITIPASVEFIGERILNHCSNLTTITVAPDNPLFDSRDHCNAIIETATNTLIQGCKTTIIPESVTALGTTAFTECYNLTSITIPKSITKIGDYVFMFCADLKDVYSLIEEPFNVSASAFSEIGVNTGYTTTLHVPYGTKEAYLKAEGWKEFKDFIVEMVATDKVIYTPNEEEKTVTVDSSDETAKVVEISPVVEIDGEKYEVTAIGEGAFENNENLEKVSIPETIEFIGDNAFAGCTGLKEIRVFAEEPIQLGSASAGTRGDDASSVFAGVDTETCTLYVPYGSKEKYENAEGWKEFKNIVEMGGPESITISGAKQVTYMSDKDLDFTGYPDLKAYVATGYDKASGTIWLTRVKEVPANTGFLLMGEADTYEIPVKAGGLSAYYQNMFKGTLEATTIYTTDGDYTNYYLSNGESGVGFYKVTKPEGQSIGANRAYLPLPTEIPVIGSEGSTEMIKVSSAGQVPYYNTQSLDFSSLDAQGVKAYTATGYDYNSGTIWLTRVKQVPAKTGILIIAPEGEYPVPTASVSSVYANMFRGTLEGTTIQTHEEIDGKDYINYYLSSGASGVGFYRVTKEEGVTIGANRCYLPILNKDAAAGTRSVNSDLNQIAIEEADEVIGIPLLRGIGGDDDGTTSIREVKSGEVKGEEWYTLQGQRVAKPGKGIYIHNGKKVVIK